MPAEVKAIKVNPDLEKERKTCTFDREELATYWIGGQSKLEEKRARGKHTPKRKRRKDRKREGEKGRGEEKVTNKFG